MKQYTKEQCIKTYQQIHTDLIDQLQSIQQLVMQTRPSMRDIDRAIRLLDRADSLNATNDLQLTSQIQAVRSLLIGRSNEIPL